jgi:histidine triad (HIT) family protein
MEGCIFCKIANHEIPVQPVYEDDEIIAFPDINPAAPVHILLVPKQHVTGVLDLAPGNIDLLARIWQVIPTLAAEHGIADAGFRVVANSGEAAGQSVPHLHFHLLGGRLLGWPPG